MSWPRRWSERVPLRVKLVAAVLVLVAGALTLISVASVVALRYYLTDQMDNQLAETIHRAEAQGPPVLTEGHIPLLPSDFLLEWRLPQLQLLAHDPRYDEADLPPLPVDLGEAMLLAGDPYTAEAQNGEARWRMQVTMLPDGTALTVAQDMSAAEDAVRRLIVAEVAVGTAVQIGLVALGIAAVRGSLRPLAEIERTAGAIAGGDLGRRVPEPADQGRTELGRLARALNAMLGHIESAFAARAASEERMRQFVADASHELRTPLTTIRGFAELYRQGAARSPEEVARLLERIEGEAARMGLLVEDLLLLARLDQQRPVRQAPVDVATVIREVVYATRAGHPHRRIEVTAAPSQPLMVTGDEARLRQVVGNLLTNAVTHTPEDTAVEVRFGRDGAFAVIEVADHGPGLTEPQRARVFERFYRVDTARTRAAGGAGLGLAIVAALVAAHRGTVEVESTPGDGATFRVLLPLMEVAEGGEDTTRDDRRSADSQREFRRDED